MERDATDDRSAGSWHGAWGIAKGLGSIWVAIGPWSARLRQTSDHVLIGQEDHPDHPTTKQVWVRTSQGFTASTMTGIVGVPCLILNRANLMALDATTDPNVGTHTLLWNEPHAAPWQRWQLLQTVPGRFRILSGHRHLALTTMAKGYESGEVWLHETLFHDWSNTWMLSPTSSGTVRILNASSGYALDSGHDARNGADPHLWPANDAPWQEWHIIPLPLA